MLGCSVHLSQSTIFCTRGLTTLLLFAVAFEFEFAKAKSVGSASKAETKSLLAWVKGKSNAALDKISSLKKVSTGA